MLNLKDFKIGMKVTGLDSQSTVEIIAVDFYGKNAANVVFKNNSGALGNKIIYSEDAAEINIFQNNSSRIFRADTQNLLTASEAYRINSAYIFDPYLAIHTSSIEPLPHQISAVYEKMLTMQPLRFVLADDPGAGKTVMSGLLIKELIARGDLQKCLIVCPGNLAEQWQEELYNKFHLQFEILTKEQIEFAATGNIFKEKNFCIARLDMLSRNDHVKEKLAASDWDLIVCDEAHKMSATVVGSKPKYTKRFRLGQLLGQISRNILLLTATPHNGKEEDFQLFMSLIDPDRFENPQKLNVTNTDVSDVMRRLVKEELLKFDGKPLFPERIAYTLNYNLSPEESKLYEDVTEYVKNEFNRAERLKNKERTTTVGFALTILQRRLASSPEAIYKSLERRTERLKKLSLEISSRKKSSIFVLKNEEDFEDLPGEEFETNEENIVNSATASQTTEEIEAEIKILQSLTDTARKVRVSGKDKKWDELSKLLQENEKIVGKNNERQKLIIFTEHRDTINYLYEKIKSLLGREESVVTIHGGMNRDDRHKMEELFKQDKNVSVLIATDAAGEGINLQRAHLMINYDLPWNPNRLEQRFGRIHRIGQTKVCYLWNLVAMETREGKVFHRLFEKLEAERRALGGKVFDILGKVSFDNKSLSEFLKEAVLYGNDEEKINYLNTVIDASLSSERLKKILTERAITTDVLNLETVSTIRKDINRTEAHKLQPYFIQNYFVNTFRKLGGRIYKVKDPTKKEYERFEITRVPSEILNFDKQNNFGKPVQEKYERICFAKEFCNVPGEIPAELIAPGHPLLSALNGLVLSKYADDLKLGTILIDRRDASENFRILFCIETLLQDEKIIPATGQRRTISKRIHFVEADENGKILFGSGAPYFDYDVPTENERQKVFTEIKNHSLLNGDVEKIATDYAVTDLIPSHRQEIFIRKKNFLDKVELAVKERLNGLIQYWDKRAIKFREKGDMLNYEKADRKANDFAERLTNRLKEIELERKISSAPPVIVWYSLIVPAGHFKDDNEKIFSENPDARKEIEQIAMQTVMDIEREEGFTPKDVSKENLGYDIESMRQDEIRFIEVKGRRADADTVTVSRNEILTALNKPDDFILAIVLTDGKNTKTVYLKNPFGTSPDFGAVSITYKIKNLIQQGNCILEKIGG